MNKLTFATILMFFASQSIFCQKKDWINESSRKAMYPTGIYLQGYWSDSKKSYETQEDLLKRLIASAKSQIIEGISVKVKSNSTLTTETSGKYFNQTFQDNISTFSESILYGLKTDVYYDKCKKTGYAFAYLRKSDLVDYHVNIITNNYEQINKCLQNSKNINNDNLKQNLVSLYSCFKSIKDMKLSQDMLITLNAASSGSISNQQIIDAEKNIKQGTAEALNKIKITPGKINLTPTLNTSWQYPISVNVTYDSNIVEGLPICFINSNSSNKIGSSISEKMGISNFILSKLPASEKEKHMAAKLDLVKLFTPDTLDITPNFTGITVPSVEFDLNIKKIPVFISQKDNCNSIVTSKLKETLVKSGFEFVANNSLANYQMQVSCNIHTSNVGDIKFAYADVALEIIDNTTANSIYQNKIPNCKGGAMDIESASNKAFLNASTQICNALVTFLSQ